MAFDPFVLSEARVLASNDDGIQAHGLHVLERVLRPLVGELWVVAPETEQSAASHSLTMRRPLYLRQVAEQRFAVDGTPTDCVLLAVHQVLKGRQPDLVLSGINRGGNLGEDVAYSGTVAAAREGALLGYRAVALSLDYRDRSRLNWETAEHWTRETLLRLAVASWPCGVVINVNFPDCPAAHVTGIEVTRQGRRKIGNSMIAGFDPRGEPYFWIGGDREEDRGLSGTDLEAVHRRAVSVTPLSLDGTHEASLPALRSVFA